MFRANTEDFNEVSVRGRIQDINIQSRGTSESGLHDRFVLENPFFLPRNSVLGYIDEQLRSPYNKVMIQAIRKGVCKCCFAIRSCAMITISMKV